MYPAEHSILKLMEAGMLATPEMIQKIVGVRSVGSVYTMVGNLKKMGYPIVTFRKKLDHGKGVIGFYCMENKLQDYRNAIDSVMKSDS